MSTEKTELILEGPDGLRLELYRGSITGSPAVAFLRGYSSTMRDASAFRRVGLSGDCCAHLNDAQVTWLRNHVDFATRWLRLEDIEPPKPEPPKWAAELAHDIIITHGSMYDVSQIHGIASLIAERCEPKEVTA